MVKGLLMNTEELKNLVVFFEKKGVSPTIKELCSISMYINTLKNRKVS
jgi:hypothetical protein